MTFILRLKTCSLLHDVVAERDHWLTRLRALGRNYAPNLPPNIDITSLATAELRELVIRSIYLYLSGAHIWKEALSNLCFAHDLCPGPKLEAENGLVDACKFRSRGSTPLR